MGALATAWQARLSAQQQRNLTNPDEEGATSVDATRLAAAEVDAQNLFRFSTGIEFDSTDAEHLTLGVVAVTYKLLCYRGMPKSASVEAARQDWEAEVQRFNVTRGNLTWQMPQTNSNLNPTQDEAGALPRFDRRVLSDLIPRPPRSGPEDNLLDGGRGA